MDSRRPPLAAQTEGKEAANTKATQTFVPADTSSGAESPIGQTSLLDQILTEICRRKANGESPDPQSYIEKYPELDGVLQLALLAEDFGSLTQNKVDSSHSVTSILTPPEGPGEIGRLGGYRVLRILGAGGMGVVFEAEDLKLERKVALKAMLPALANHASAKVRFLREAKAAASLKNPHVVTIFQVDEDRGVPFLAMEFLEGESLDACLERQPVLASAEVLHVGKQIAEGLAAAHAKGLIHRDIKPANIWLEGSNKHVKILDFGLARAFSQESELTQQGAVIGTPAYMAPEQSRGESLDQRCDLFSLGTVLYRLCTGEQPFKRKDAVSTLVAVATHQPLPPEKHIAKVPPALSAIVMKLLEKEPAQRYTSAMEVVDAFSALEKQTAPSSDCSVFVPTSPANINSGQATDSPRSESAPTHNLAEGASEAAKVAATPIHTSTSETVATPTPATGGIRSRIVPVGIVAIGFLFGAVALLGGGVYYIVTDKGTIEIKTEDERIRVSVLKNGQEIEILDPASNKTWSIRTGTYTVRLKDDPDGLEIVMPNTFEMKRGGKHVVTIRKLKGPIAGVKGIEDRVQAAADPHITDRKIAEWVLDIKGSVKVLHEGVEKEAHESAQLPGGNITLLEVRLGGNPAVNNSNVVRLKDATRLRNLDLGHNGGITDAGMAWLGNLTNLEELCLWHSDITGKTVEKMRPLTKMKVLLLNSVPIGDNALNGISEMKELERLSLAGTNLTEASMLVISQLPKLRSLGIHKMPLTSAGLKQLQSLENLDDLDIPGDRLAEKEIGLLAKMRKLRLLRMSNLPVRGKLLEPLASLQELEELDLPHAQLSPGNMCRLGALKTLKILVLNGANLRDADMAQIEFPPNLTRLDLFDTSIGNNALVHLEKLNSLESLRLDGTKVNNAGIDKLLRALPNCRIEWNGKVFALTPEKQGAFDQEAERRSAKWMLELKVERHVWIADLDGGRVREIGQINELPDKFKVVDVFIGGDANLTDDQVLAYLTKLSAVRRFNLGECTHLTDKSLVPLANVPNLREVYLGGSWGGPTRAGDATVRALAANPSIRELALSSVGASPAGLKAIGKLSALTSLYLRNVDANDEVLAVVAGMPDLEFLHINAPKNPGAIAGAGLVNCRRCVKLRFLGLGDCQIKGENLKHLRGMEALETLLISDSQTGDDDLEHVSDLPKLTELALNATRVGNKGMAHLAALKNLRRLDLSGTAVNDAGFKAMSQWPSLAILIATNTKVGDAGAKALGQIRQLEYLELGGCPRVGDDGATGLGATPRLRFLGLNGSSVGDKGAMALAQAPALEELRLGDTPVTDAGVKALAKHHRLATLSLANTRVSNEGLAALADLKTLRSLDITGTKVTADGVKKFKAVRPNCEVIGP